MSETLTATAPFAAELEAALARADSEGVRELRRQAAERFRALGFPGPKDEEWRQTNVGPVARTRFARPASAEGGFMGRSAVPARSRVVQVQLR